MHLPYDLWVNEEEASFTFVTDQQATFLCLIQPSLRELFPVLPMFDIDMYEFIFYKMDEPEGLSYVKDNRVGATLVHLITNFFSSSPHRVLFYFCDYSDGKDHQRQMLFGRWFGHYSGGQYQRVPLSVSREIGGELQTLHGGVIFRTDFPERQALQDNFIDRAEDAAFNKYFGA